jgi:AcrR family transcriptional regulator
MCSTVRSGALAWGDVAARFPPRPDPGLDDVLDAAARCVERHGVRRTTMTDIAREAGIARSTLYQKVSSVEQALLAHTTRELHRFFDEHGEDDDVTTARGLVSAMAELVEWTWAQPAYARLLDEPEVLQGLFSSRHTLLDVVAPLLRPPTELLIDAGVVRRHDPALLAGWIARTLVVLALAPPPGDLEAALVALVLPALEP